MHTNSRPPSNRDRWQRRVRRAVESEARARALLLGVSAGPSAPYVLGFHDGVNDILGDLSRWEGATEDEYLVGFADGRRHMTDAERVLCTTQVPGPTDLIGSISGHADLEHGERVFGHEFPDGSLLLQCPEGWEATHGNGTLAGGDRPAAWRPRSKAVLDAL